MISSGLIWIVTQVISNTKVFVRIYDADYIALGDLKTKFAEEDGYVITPGDVRQTLETRE